MTPDENRARVLSMFEDVINGHDTSDIERYTLNPTVIGTVRGLLTAFPDIHFDVVWAVAEADRVVCFIEMSGTHEGPWMMVPEGTHRPMQASIMLAVQLDEEGKVVDTWLGTNFISMLAQLGWGVAEAGQQVPEQR